MLFGCSVCVECLLKEALLRLKNKTGGRCWGNGKGRKERREWRVKLLDKSNLCLTDGLIISVRELKGAGC